MSKTITKQKNKIHTLSDLNNNEDEAEDNNYQPKELVLKLSTTFKEADDEIKKLRREIRDNKHLNKIIIDGLLNRIKDLETIKANNEKLLLELGTKQDYIDNANEELNNINKISINSLKNYKPNYNKDDEHLTNEELEALNKRGIEMLNELLKNK